MIAHAVSVDHNYSSKSGSSHPTHLKGIKLENRFLENHFLKNTAVIPEFCPELTKTHTPVHLVHTCPEEPLLIHGNSTEDHQRMSRAVVDSMLKKSSGKPRTYSLKLGLRVKQRLWKTQNCPTMLEEEQSDGLIQVKEMFTKPNLKRSATRINVDISGEPLPYAPQRKRPCMWHSCRANIVNNVYIVHSFGINTCYLLIWICLCLFNFMTMPLLLVGKFNKKCSKWVYPT